jgi:hypothetical protein
MAAGLSQGMTLVHRAKNCVSLVSTYAMQGTGVDFLIDCSLFKIAERVKLSKTRSESSSSDRPVLGSEISSIGVSVGDGPGKKELYNSTRTLAPRGQKC